MNTRTCIILRLIIGSVNKINDLSLSITCGKYRDEMKDY
jgi:hypothetical protein